MEFGPTPISHTDHDHGDRDGVDERGVLAAARAAILGERRAGCQLLEAAAVWADLHVVCQREGTTGLP